MKLASHGTGGARRRERWHCREHRPLEYRGRYGDMDVYRVHATDGRTYELTLTPADVEAVAERASKQRNLGV